MRVISKTSGLSKIVFELIMKNNITLLILSLSAITLFSQDTIMRQNTTHRISIKSGFYKYSTRDNVYSPLIYTGLSFPVNLEYFNNKENSNYTIYFQYTNTKLSSSITQKTYDGEYVANYFEFINAKLEFSYLRQYKSYSNWDLNIGGSWENFVLYKNQVLVYDNTQWALDVFSNIKLALNIQKEIQGKNLLQFKFSYPLVSYVIGRVYAPQHLPEKLLKYDNLSMINILKSGDFLTINNFVNFEFNAKYFMRLGNRYDLYTEYGFQYYRYPKMNIVKNAMHSLLIGITLKL